MATETLACVWFSGGTATPLAPYIGAATGLYVGDKTSKYVGEVYDNIFGK